MMDNQTTEKKILEAARRVFIQKGMDGARMQEIADEAGINKALLHYYYRSKDKLFEAVFQETFVAFFGRINLVFKSEMTLKEKLFQFIDGYIDTISANPFVPQFILSEINRDPFVMKKMMDRSGFYPQQLVPIFESQLKNTKVDVRQFIVSLISMCVFPYLARPLLQNLIFEDDATTYEQFLSDRRDFLKGMVLKFIENNE
jgi:AcrR family transcriptional regulator